MIADTHPQEEKRATLNLKSLPLARINKPHPENPRTLPAEGSPERSTLRASLAHDYFDPVIWNERNGLLVSGHVRVPEMIALGFTHADVVVVDYDEPTHLARMLAANAHSGKNESGKLEALYTSLRQTSINPVLALLQALPPAKMVPKNGDAEVPLTRAEELNQKWGCVRGAVFRIGGHRLMCGDSTSAMDVAHLLAGAVPNLMVTDPPYGIEYDAGWREEAAEAGAASCGVPGGRAVGEVLNDDVADWSEAWRHFTGNVAYVWHADKKTHIVAQSLIAHDFGLRSLIIWGKKQLVLSRGHYHSQHEPCWYAVRDGEAAQFIGDRKQTTLWTIEKPRKSETGHSTQKPLECMSRAIANHEGNVYDPFLGSGTTMVAAENEGRVCHGMEINPPHCAVILERMSTAFPGITIERL